MAGDDTYFDASFELHLNGELFFENGTTDAYTTWRNFVHAKREPGEHKIYFLDSSVELQVIHQEHYIFQYVHTDYIWDDNGHLLNRIETTITSETLPKEVVESAIREGFLQYADFILTNDIAIAKDYKNEIQQQLQMWEE